MGCGEECWKVSIENSSFMISLGCYSWFVDEITYLTKTR
jgi:hypothetical protein